MSSMCSYVDRNIKFWIVLNRKSYLKNNKEKKKRINLKKKKKKKKLKIN